MRRRALSLRWRLALGTALLIFVAILALTLYTIGRERELYVASTASQLRAEARLVADQASPFIPGDASSVQALVAAYGKDTGDWVTIVTAEGVLLGDSGTTAATTGNRAVRQEIAAVATSAAGERVGYSSALGVNFLYVSMPITKQGELVGFSRVARPVAAVEASLDELTRIVVAATIVIASASGAVALAFAERATRPLIELRDMAREFGVGKLRRRLRLRGRGEIADLGRAFDRMADELERSMGSMETEHAKLEAIVEALAVGIIMVDESKRIVLTNAAAAQLVRLRGDVIGRPLIEVVIDHELDELLADALGHHQRREHIQERLQPRRTLRIVAAPVRAGHERLGLLVLQDLTETRRLETARRDFVANISHELRTPLASIKALVETLQDGALDDPPQARHFLEQVDGEVDQLTQLVRELLELSRIESGLVPIQREVVDVRELVAPVMERLRTQAERAQLTLELCVDDDTPPIFADTQRMGQALLNLLHNAIKFTPAGGRIAIKARSERETVAISVVDSGEGIAPEDLPRIFERFYKADKARSQTGTGLGLAIVKHIVEAHGGTVRAESTLGKGTTFTVTLLAATAKVGSSS